LGLAFVAQERNAPLGSCIGGPHRRPRDELLPLGCACFANVAPEQPVERLQCVVGDSFTLRRGDRRRTTGAPKDAVKCICQQADEARISQPFLWEPEGGRPKAT
jgi:hypothetical protein